jgi:ribosomal protein S9
MKKFQFLIFVLFAWITLASYAQEVPIEIEEEKVNNRLLLFAVNKNLKDYDVSIEVEGTGFKQRNGAPRKVRVPATSRVNLISLVIERLHQPMYTYKLDVSDSLSRRAIRKEYELIKIDPKKPITLYLTDLCTSKCDSLIAALENSVYNYKSVKLSDDNNIKTQLASSLVGGSERLDNMDTPIVMLGGKMYVKIETYEELMARLAEED